MHYIVDYQPTTEKPRLQLMVQLTLLPFVDRTTGYMIYIDKRKNVVSTAADVNRWSLKLALIVANLDKYRDEHCQHTEETKENTDARSLYYRDGNLLRRIRRVKGVGKARGDKSVRVRFISSVYSYDGLVVREGHRVNAGISMRISPWREKSRAPDGRWNFARNRVSPHNLAVNFPV